MATAPSSTPLSSQTGPAPTAQSTPPAGAEPASSPARPWLRRIFSVRADYRLTSSIFLRLLGVVYLCAFGALWPQIPGLLGRHGLLPVADFLARVAGPSGAPDFWHLPTLAWLDAGDGFLLLLCGAGVVLALLLIVGLLPGPVLALLWLCYLSLVNVGQDFLSFQWDVLLLEVGFLAIFLAPWQLRLGATGAAPPSFAVLWFLRLVLFRLMFFSGYVKLASGDPTWHNLVALNYHYWTQPLPNPLAWWMAQLPRVFQQSSVIATFVVELAAPCLIFGPRPLRFIAAVLIAGLQLLIEGTGNFGFFNLLTLSLCLLLLDDRALRRLVPARLANRLAVPGPAPAAPRWQPILTVPLTALILFLSALQLVDQLPFPIVVPIQARSAAGWFQPFNLVNSYGLFAVMTTSRPEIIIEGSADGQTWHEYRFHYKPGDLYRPPPLIAPYQPRLDWQMWFAALSTPEANAWFPALMHALLLGTPEVVGLLDTNPFPQAPPRYVRALLYNYHFTKGLTPPGGAWWQRDLAGTYYPIESLPGR